MYVLCCSLDGETSHVYIPHKSCYSVQVPRKKEGLFTSCTNGFTHYLQPMLRVLWNAITFCLACEPQRATAHRKTPVICSTHHRGPYQNEVVGLGEGRISKFSTPGGGDTWELSGAIWETLFVASSCHAVDHKRRDASLARIVVRHAHDNRRAV